MAYNITDDCTNCGSCVESCPAEAIKEGESKHSIDLEACLECGACVDSCPTSAIVEE